MTNCFDRREMLNKTLREFGITQKELCDRTRELASIGGRPVGTDQLSRYLRGVKGKDIYAQALCTLEAALPPAARAYYLGLQSVSVNSCHDQFRKAALDSFDSAVA